MEPLLKHRAKSFDFCIAFCITHKDRQALIRKRSQLIKGEIVMPQDARIQDKLRENTVIRVLQKTPGKSDLTYASTVANFIKTSGVDTSGPVEKQLSDAITQMDYAYSASFTVTREL